MPYLSSTIFVVTAVVGLSLTMAAFALLLSSLFPKTVDRAEESFRTRPVMSVFVGFPVLAMTLGITAILLGAASPGARALGILSGSSLAAVVFTGLAGVASHIGGGLAPEGSIRFTRIRRGMVVLQLSMMLPILGWFFVLPLALAASLGVIARGLFSRRAPSPHTEVTWAPTAQSFTNAPASYVPIASAYATQVEAYRGTTR